MQFIIVTGMSGAGKSTVVNILEDIGFYCVDNLPPELISDFHILCQNSNILKEKVAFVVDARSGERIKELAGEIKNLKAEGQNVEVLFLEASDETIIKRYKETRRKHPNSTEGLLADGILKERELLSEIRLDADYIVDTSALLPRQLREQILALFETKIKFENINVNVVSFGFKRGIPLDADLVFDVRFLPNPFYVSELKELTGLNERVSGYVLEDELTKTFLDKLYDMIKFLLPLYIKEGKNRIVIAIGCTGGKHRSVTVAEELAGYLKEKNYYTVVKHRDIGF